MLFMLRIKLIYLTDVSPVWPPKEWGEEDQTYIENILEILNFAQVL